MNLNRKEFQYIRYLLSVEKVCRHYFIMSKTCLDHVKEEQVVFEKEYMIKEPDFSNEPYTVEKSEEEEWLYIVEGPRIERMLGYTNLDSEKGFEFFQKFLKTNGILDELEKLGIEEGDTVKMYGWQFEFMR